MFRSRSFGERGSSRCCAYRTLAGALWRAAWRTVQPLAPGGWWAHLLGATLSVSPTGRLCPACSARLRARTPRAPASPSPSNSAVLQSPSSGQVCFAIQLQPRSTTSFVFCVLCCFFFAAGLPRPAVTNVCAFVFICVGGLVSPMPCVDTLVSPRPCLCSGGLVSPEPKTKAVLCCCMPRRLSSSVLASLMAGV